MNKDVKITAEQLRQAVHGDMEKLLDEVTGAVNTAPYGPKTHPDARSRLKRDLQSSSVWRIRPVTWVIETVELSLC